MALDPKGLYDEKGKKSGVLLKIKAFEKLVEELEDLHDLKTIYKQKNKKFRPIPYEKIKKELFGNDGKK